MVTFDEEREDKQMEDIREKEEERLADMLAVKYGLPYQNLTITPLNVNALRIASEDEVRKAGVAIFARVGKRIKIGVKSPENEATKVFLKKLENDGYDITTYMVSQRSLEHVWERYGDLSQASGSTQGTLNISSEVVEKLMREIKVIDDVKNKLDEIMKTEKSYRVSRLAETLMGGGLALDVSDVHIEPQEESVRLRYRLDGVLTDILYIDHDTGRLLSSRLKLISGLYVNIADEAQDGRFSISVGENEIEVRTSALPGPYGESIVMRLLDPSSINVPLESLGIHPRLLEVIKEEVSRPNGMLLTTGPTGSGKTTTLYALMKFLYNPTIKIITIENPIEYHLTGIVQTQVDHETGYTFLAGLRSALRQDPDVIMVGEIRDNETADTAVNSALTGHLVFSTLHTNTAAGAFPRLLGLGVNPKIVTSAINIVLAQRLVRRLCENCKYEREPTPQEREEIDTIIESIADKTYLEGIHTENVWDAKGCEKCNQTRFKGRVSVTEGILSDSAVENIVIQNPSAREIREAAKPQRLLTMAQDGMLKVLQGITSIEELKRVIDLSEI